MEDHGGAERTQDLLLVDVFCLPLAALGRRTTVCAAGDGLAGIRRQPVEIVGERDVALLKVAILGELDGRTRRLEQHFILERLGPILLCGEHESPFWKAGALSRLLGRRRPWFREIECRRSTDMGTKEELASACSAKACPG